MENDTQLTFLEFVRQTRPEFKGMKKAEFIRRIAAECGRQRLQVGRIYPIGRPTDELLL